MSNQIKFMKYIIKFFLFFPLLLFSQIEDPVSWSFNVESLGNDEYKLVVSAEIEDGWHIYSQYKDPESFIVSTAFYFEDKTDLDFINSVTEPVTYPFNGNKVFLMNQMLLKNLSQFKMSLQDILKILRNSLKQ